MTTKELYSKAADSAASCRTTSPDDLLNETEVATMLALAPGTLRNWRSLGVNIPYSKVGKRAVRYRRSDVEAFLVRGMANVEVA